MGGEEDENSLSTILEIFQTSPGELLPRTGPKSPLTSPNPFRSRPNSPRTASVPSKILDELRNRKPPTYEPETLPRRRTIQFGNLPGQFPKPLETSLLEKEETSGKLSSTLTSTPYSNSSIEYVCHSQVDEKPPSSWTKEIQELKEQVDQLKNENLQQRKSFDMQEYSYKEEIAALQEQRDRILVKYDADKQLTQHELDHIQEENASLRQTLESLEMKQVFDAVSHAMDAEKIEPRKSVESLEEEIGQLRASFEYEVQKTLRCHDGKHAEEMENLEREKWDLEDQLNDAKKSLKKTIVQLSELRNRLETLEVEKKDLEIRAVENEIAYLDLEEERDQLKARCDSLENQMEIHAQVVNKVTKEMDSLRQQHINLSQETEQLHKQVTSVTEEKVRLTKELTEAITDTEAISNKVKAAREEHTKKAQELVEQTNNLSKQIQNRMTEEEELKKEIDRLETKHETLEQHYETLQNSIEELNEVVSREAERMDTLQENRRSLADEITILIEVNEELRSKVEFWRDSVKEVETELVSISSADSKQSTRSLNGTTFTRIQKIYEQRLMDQEYRFNRLWDDIVISNEHLLNENQNLQLQLSDMGNHRDSFVNYVNELENQPEPSREMDPSAELDVVSPELEQVIVKAEKEGTTPFSIVIKDYQRRINALGGDRQELISYARKLEYEVEHLAQELQRKGNSSRRSSQSLAPPTPSDSVNQESLIPYTSFQNDSFVRNRVPPKNVTESSFESGGFASLFADIDQMKDEMMKLSQLNTRLQNDCHVLKTDRDRLAKEMNRLVDENTVLINERKEFLVTSEMSMESIRTSLPLKDSDSPGFRCDLRKLTTVEDKIDIGALLLQIYGIKEMLETDSQLLTEIQITLSPDSVESTRASDVLSDDSRGSSKPINREQITRLFTSLRSLIQNQASLIGNAQEIIHQLHHIHGSDNLSTIVQENHPKIHNRKQESRLKDQVAEGDNTFKLASGHLFAKKPPRLQRRQSAFETRREPGQMYQLTGIEARSLRQDFQDLEEQCHTLRTEKQLLTQEKVHLRRRLQEAHDKIRQRNLLMENLEVKIQDLVRAKDQEYTLSTDKICQLEYDLQTKMNKIMALTRERNRILQDNKEFHRELIKLNEAIRQLEVDLQSENEMSKSFQNQLRVLKDSLRIEQHEKRSKTNQIARLEATISEKTGECLRLQDALGSQRRNDVDQTMPFRIREPTTDLNLQLNTKSRLNRAEKEVMFLRQELRYGSLEPFSPATSQSTR